MTDGAALVLLARRSAALKLQLQILARFVSFAVAGVDPEVMGVGPAVAIPKALGEGERKGGRTNNLVDNKLSCSLLV